MKEEMKEKTKEEMKEEVKEEMKEKVKEKVLKLCQDKGWNWKPHLFYVVKYAKLLAKEQGADEEAVELAAWLHDIHKIEVGRDLHHVHGSERAAAILKKEGCSEETIEKVKYCILTHSSDESYPPETKEAKILASADALSHLDMFVEMTVKASSKFDNSEDLKEWLVKKYKRSWKKVVTEARHLGQKKYDAIMLLLK